MRICYGVNSEGGREVAGCEQVGVRVREQLMVVWVVSRGESRVYRAVVSGAAENS